MATTDLDLIAELANIAALTRGLRTDSQAILDGIASHTDSLFGFVCLEDESASIRIVASNGLDAANFRRLEKRAARSALTRVFDLVEPTRLLINDEPTLDFLSDERIVGEIISAPVMQASRCIGSVSLAFDKKKNRPSLEMIKLIEIAAAIVAQIVASGQTQQDESRKLIEENITLKQSLREKYDLSRLIGNSSPMRAVYDQVTQVARSNATVLLRGESGTGKELIASAIHYNSLRSKQSFVRINCASLPDTIIDAELFGDEQGTQTKIGHFESAEGGTIFLDEVGDLPRQTQIKLLRVLQDREFERLGGTETLRANVRVIAASNTDLEDLIADGAFREELFYRLNVFTIFLPPLRDRKSDILLLADHFLRKYALEHNKDILRISTPAIDMLAAYHFPGNVRELENAIESAVLISDANVIHGHHLPPTLQTAEITDTETRVTLESAVAAFERDLIQDALKSTRGNVAKAAKMLDSTERILGYKVKKYSIDARRFK